jgi:RNA polymerase sigma-70 factor, ECF subfamily
MNVHQNADSAEQILQHGPWVQAVAYAIVQDHQLAEDIRQDVFLEALQGSWKGVRIRRAWLVGMSKHRALNILRSRRRALNREARYSVSERAQPTKQISEALESQQQILKSLQSLSEPDRRIIYQRFFEERSFDEIAAEFAINVATARVRLHRALGRLRQLLQHSDGGWWDCCVLAMGTGKWATSGLQSLALTSTAATLVTMVGLLSWIFWPTDRHLQGMDSETKLGLEASESQFELSGSASNAPKRKEITFAVHGNSDPFAPPENAVNLVQGSVLWNGDPAPFATLTCFQAGKRWSVIADQTGIFEFDIAPDFPFQVIAELKGLFGVAATDRRPLLIELNDLNLFPKQTLLISDGATEMPIPGASVKISLLQFPQENFPIAQIGNGEILYQGVSDKDGKIPFPPNISWGSPVCEVQAPGYQPFLGGAFVSFTNGFGINLKMGGEAKVKIQDLEGIGIAGVTVWAGSAASRPFLTDQDGVALGGHLLTSRRTSGGETELTVEGLKLQLPSGRIWLPEPDPFGNVQTPSVTATPDSLTIQVDDSPVEVQVQGAKLPPGVTLEVARIAPRFCERSLQAGKEVQIGGGVSCTWHPAQPGSKITIQDGFIGANSWVVARLLPGKVLVDSAQILNGKAALSVNLAPIQLTFDSVSSFVSESLTLELETEFFSYRPRVKQFIFSILNGEVKAWVPPGNYEIRVASAEDFPKSGIDQDLNCHLFEGVEMFRIGESGLVGQVRLPDAHVQRVQVLMDGIPVVGGSINGISLNVDGSILLPILESGKALLSFPSLYPAGMLTRQPGGPIWVKGFLPRNDDLYTPVSLTQGDPLQWNIELVRLELDLNGLEIDENAVIEFTALPRSPAAALGDENQKYRSRTFLANLTKFVVNYPQPLRVGIGTTTLSLRVPSGRYRIQIEGHSFTPPEGMAFDPGQIYRLKPIDG